MMAGEVIKTVKLTDEQADRLFAVLEGASAKFIARLMEEYMQRHALEVSKTWREVARIAGVDLATHKLQISYVTNEIIVRELEKDDEDE